MRVADVHDNNESSLDGLVSVVTPAFNSERLIRGAVESVAAQSARSKEHIVVDDGSSDGTYEQLQELKIAHPHLVVAQQKHQGAAAARNLGIELATGRYIAFLDADDLWMEDKLLSQSRFMEDHEIGFTYGDYEVIDARNSGRRCVLKMPETLTYKDLLQGCPIGCLTVAFNQELYGKVYMPAVRRGQDWALWLKLTRNGESAAKYPGMLAQYRFGQASLSKAKFRKILDIFSIYRREERLSLPHTLTLMTRHILKARKKAWRIKHGS